MFDQKIEKFANFFGDSSNGHLARVHPALQESSAEHAAAQLLGAVHLEVRGQFFSSALGAIQG
jgi:hypothetical protein